MSGCPLIHCRSPEIKFNKLDQSPSDLPLVKQGRSEGKLYNYELCERIAPLPKPEKRKEFIQALTSLIFSFGLAWFSPKVKTWWREGVSGERKDIVYLKGSLVEDKKETKTFQEVHSKTENKNNETETKIKEKSSLESKSKEENKIESKEDDLEPKSKEIEENEDLKWAIEWMKLKIRGWEYEKGAVASKVFQTHEYKDCDTDEQCAFQDKINGFFGMGPVDLKPDLFEERTWEKLSFSEQKALYEESLELDIEDSFTGQILLFECDVYSWITDPNIVYPFYAPGHLSFFKKMETPESEWETLTSKKSEENNEDTETLEKLIEKEKEIKSDIGKIERNKYREKRLLRYMQSAGNLAETADNIILNEKQEDFLDRSIHYFGESSLDCSPQNFENLPWEKLSFREQKELYDQAKALDVEGNFKNSILYYEKFVYSYDEQIKSYKYPYYAKNHLSFFEKMKNPEKYLQI